MKRLTPLLTVGVLAASCASTSKSSTPEVPAQTAAAPVAAAPVADCQSAEQARASAKQAYMSEQAKREDAETTARNLTTINMALHRGIDAAGAELAQAAQVTESAEETKVTVSGLVLFKSNEAELMPIAEETLGAVANALAGKVDDKQVIIEGFTDALGTAAHNDKLSEERAEQVLQFLVAHGVDGTKVMAVGRGEALPIASNDNPEGRANNRRVEITIRPG